MENQPVNATIEGQVRLPIPHIEGKICNLAARDIRRIRQDCRKSFFCGTQRVEQIALTKVNPFAHAVPLRIVPGHTQGSSGNVRRPDLDIAPFMSEADGDRTAPCPKLEYAEWARPR